MASDFRISMPDGICVLQPIHERAIRVRFFPHETNPSATSVVIISPEIPSFLTEESSNEVTVCTSKIRATLNKTTGSLIFSDSTGKILLREKPDTRKLVANTVQGEDCLLVEQTFLSPADEHLHGLGQFQDGHFNLRTASRRLVQVNTQIAIPFLISNQGYGLLWHQYGLTDFNPTDAVVPLEKDPSEGPEYSITVTGSTGEFKETGRIRTYFGTVEIPVDGDYGFFLDYGEMTNRHDLEIDGSPVIRQENFWLPPAADAQVKLKAGTRQIKITATKGTPNLSWRALTDTTTLRSPHANALDYVVFAGPSADEIISTYRQITGAAPLLPRWAYGFWQCRERYVSQEQLLENAREHRDRRLPVDVMVQDWQYWPKEQWAGMQFDAARYPDPAGMVQSLRDLHLQLVISVWENVSKDSDIGKAYDASGSYIPDSPWLDMTNPAVRTAHWSAIDKNLNTLGIAGWWLDATEPENDALAGKMTHLGPGEFHRLTYPLYVSQAVHDGQRSSTPERRVCILTRSAFPGQQRYGTITWSGDIGWDWDAFRRQIVAGLNYSASGLPYWTTDIGGFFRPVDQYTNVDYHEILTRWFQFGVFNPIFRIHGFGTDTEIWRFGTQFENVARRMLDLRYRLLPYIYSLAWQVTRAGTSIMRPLIMDFPGDSIALDRPFQFMFGPAFLVSPVTERGLASQETYLPKTAGWHDFWTGRMEHGGQNVNTASTLDQIPVFVRAGSIVPLGPLLQYTNEMPADPIELRIYPGTDGTFLLYEDAGDGHAYEEGEHATISVMWQEVDRRLIMGTRQGTFPGMLNQRTFHIVCVRAGHGTGVEVTTLPDAIINYTGVEISIQIP
jgi:alpha-D-xyloside xylohydrolase